MRNECNIIRDILPLYIEDMVSADTVSFVEEHLNDCAACRAELENMKQSNSLEKIYENNSAGLKDEAAPLKAIKRKMRKRKIMTIALSSVSAIAVVFGIFFLLIFYGVPISSEKVELATEFQYNDTAYLNQSFSLHINRLDGTPLNAEVENVYEQDEYGKKILVGYKITPRAVAFNLGQHPGSYTIGYTYSDDTAPNEDFDFTITVTFSDKTVVYSMVEEGLFVPQDDVVRFGE